MRKQIVRIAVMTAAMTACMTISALAAGWKTDNSGRWYENSDGSYPRNQWQWIDNDGDGISECYYFDENGYVLENTTTPDGCEVNGIGAWVKNGEIQTQAGGTGSGSTDFGGTGSDGTGWNDWYDWSDWGNWGGYNNDPEWYDHVEGLSEGDRAAYHYDAKYYNWDSRTPEYIGKVQEQYNRIYANPTAETAAAEMVWVDIPVWRLRNGQKVADTTRIQGLSSIADEVKEIFTEIYNGPEQFPINSIGGYAWRSNGLGSNHSAGLAIDINPDQNPQVREDGTVLVGNKWEPGVNPYSIGRDSDVVKAFGKHGWGWGASFYTKDYMHFDW